MSKEFISIDNFQKNSFFRKGFITDSRFEVTFIKQSESKVENLNEKDLKWNVKSVEMPSFALGGGDNDRLHQKISGRAYGDLSITFFESIDQDIRGFFYGWIENLSSWNSSDINFGEVQGYLDYYVCDIQITNLKGKGEDAKTDLFSKAFPKTISSRSYNIESEAEVGTTTVTFGYKFHDFK